MARPASGDRGWRLVASVLLVGGLFACVGISAVEGSDRGSSIALGVVLGIAAIVAGAMAVDLLSGRVAISLSASFVVILLAAAFLGPVSACLAAILAEVAAAVRFKTRLY